MRSSRSRTLDPLPVPVRWVARPLHSRAPVVIGAVPVDVSLGVGWADVRDYAIRLDGYIEALDADADAQIVYADPASVEAAAAEADKGSVMNGPIGDELRAQAKLLRARAKKRGAEATARDLAWASRWADFWRRWKDWFAVVTGPSTLAPSGSVSWGRNQAFEQEYRQLAALFGALKETKVTRPPPESIESPTGKKEDEPKGLAGVGDTLTSAAKVIGAGLLGLGGLCVVGRFAGR